MEYRRLGSTGLKVSSLGLGTFPFDSNFWGPEGNENATQVIKKAVNLGINYFNSAYEYGKGHCEIVLGEGLKQVRRDKMIIAIKVGYKDDGTFDLSRDYILSSCEATLKRLQADHIDIFLFHWPDPRTPIKESMRAMLELKKQKLIRFIGASNFSVARLKAARQHGPVEVAEFYYSLLTREPEKELLSFCKKNNIGTTPFKVIERGLFTGRFDRDTIFPSGDVRANDQKFQGKRFLYNLKMTEQLKLIAKRYGRTVAQLAIAWVLSRKEISTCLVGIQKVEELEEDIDGVGWEISKKDKKEIEKILSSG